jgi:hypothetical protein
MNPPRLSDLMSDEFSTHQVRKTGRINRASNEKDGEDSSRIKSERRGGLIAHQMRKTGRIHRASNQKDGEDSSRIKSERGFKV